MPPAATHGKGLFRGSSSYSPVLPVSILSFTGEAVGPFNRLQWQVDNEMNVLSYEVERSADGLRFNSISMLPATNSVKYFYDDVLTNYQSFFYYRLKTVDQDGNYNYSPVILIRRNGKAGLVVLGTPVSTQLDLLITVTGNSKGQINVYDAAGKLLRKETMTLANGQNKYTVRNLNALPAGTYIVEAITNNQRWRQRFIKN